MALPLLPCAAHVWFLVPLQTPAVLRPCAGCHRVTRYRSSDKFRVNGNGRRLDVWLIHRCEVCGDRWNATIHERVSPQSLSQQRHQAFMDNDRQLAWQIAFDPHFHQRWGARVEPRVPFELRGRVDGVSRFRIETGAPDIARLDQVLATGLGISRRAVHDALASGALRIPGATRRTLRRGVRGGERVSWR